jgi:hypothetical protein
MDEEEVVGPEALQLIKDLYVCCYSNLQMEMHGGRVNVYQ